MKFAICNEVFKNWEWEKTVSYVAKTGYDGIELAPFTFASSINQVSANEKERIRSLATQNNLEITGLHWLLATPNGLSLSSPEKDIREKTIEYLKELINFCADLDGRVMVFGSPKQRDIAPSSNYKETWNYLKDAFLKILPLAVERNVVIALEPLARSETNFINTAGEAIKMITELNHPNLRLNLDVKAMSDEKEPIQEIITSARDCLVHFHANDPNLLGPGFGETDYQPIVEALEKIGYNGYISVEVFDFSPGAEIIAERSIRYLKDVFG